MHISKFAELKRGTSATWREITKGIMQNKILNLHSSTLIKLGEYHGYRPGNNNTLAFFWIVLVKNCKSRWASFREKPQWVMERANTILHPPTAVRAWRLCDLNEVLVICRSADLRKSYAFMPAPWTEKWSSCGKKCDYLARTMAI